LARAAVTLSLVLVVHGVQSLQERRLGGRSTRRRSLARGSGLRDSHLGGGGGAWTALGLTVGLVTSRLLALKFALGLSAVGGLDALVCAVQLLAHRGALGFGGSAGGVATCGLAHGLALGASVLLTLLLRAADGAHGTLAVDGALGTRGLLALHLALRARAHGVADSRAGGVITLPLALRVAFVSEDWQNA